MDRSPLFSLSFFLLFLTLHAQINLATSSYALTDPSIAKSDGFLQSSSPRNDNTLKEDTYGSTKDVVFSDDKLLVKKEETPSNGKDNKVLNQKDDNNVRSSNDDNIRSNNEPIESGFVEHSSIEITRKSWGDKFEESFYLCIFGAILFICAFPTLWFNERRAVRTSELISEGLKACRPLDANLVKPENNHKLVYLSGKAESPTPVKDELLGVEVDKALKLMRKVEMYQYKEVKSSSKKRDAFGGGETTVTTYNYTKIWDDKVIDSGAFGDKEYAGKNPKFLIQNEYFHTKTGHIGEFQIANHQLEMLKSYTSLPLQENSKNGFSLDFLEKVKSISTLEKVTVEGDYIYIHTGNDKENAIGDLRISFQYVPEETLSVICCQDDKSFQPYDYKNESKKQVDESTAFIQKPDMNLNFDDEDRENCCVKCCPCCICCICCAGVESLCKTTTTIDWLYEKQLTMEDIFDIKEKENRLTTWCLRIGGFLMMVFGISLFFSPVYEILEILPLLSSLGKLVVFIFALLVSIPICSIIIMVAWMFYRPKVALVFLVIILAFGGVLYYILRKTGEMSEGF